MRGGHGEKRNSVLEDKRELYIQRFEFQARNIECDGEKLEVENISITWTNSQTMIPRSPYTPLPDNIDTTWAEESADADSFGASGVAIK